jgi:hypothetical protein
METPTSAPRLGSPLAHLRRDWARPLHICAGTGLAPCTSAPGLRSPLPDLRHDCGLRHAALHRCCFSTTQAAFVVPIVFVALLAWSLSSAGVRFDADGCACRFAVCMRPSGSDGN